MISLFDGPIPFAPVKSTPATPPRRPARFQSLQTSYDAAQINRMNEDWAIALLSPDQEVRVSLRNLRARSRQLVMNDEHAQRFVRAAKEQVIGASGVSMEVGLGDDDFTGGKKFADQVEKAWQRFSKCVTADGKLDLTAAAQLWLITLLVDGEAFTQKLKGYPYNASQLAIQFIDADQVDINWQRLKRPGDPDGFNEIRMGVEVDRYRRPVAFYVYEGHPSEFAGIIRLRVDAAQLDQAFIMARTGQTRGVPFMHATMAKLNQLSQYDMAEVIASRYAACKMAMLTSELDPDELPEGTGTENGSQQEGDTRITVEPGTIDTLPPGVDIKTVDWQHPSHNYESFSMTALRGISQGLNLSYTTLTGDLRAVNFSSIRQGILSEREGWQMLQALAVGKFYKPLFATWLSMAQLTGQVVLPPGMKPEDVCDAVIWTPRGWDWVDPKKDVDASVQAVRSGLSTLQIECAKRGKDYEKILRQRAKEDQLAKDLDLVLDFTSSGAGGLQGDVAEEDPERGAQPTTGTKTPAAPRPPAPQPKPAPAPSRKGK